MKLRKNTSQNSLTKGLEWGPEWLAKKKDVFTPHDPPLKFGHNLKVAP